MQNILAIIFASNSQIQSPVIYQNNISYIFMRKCIKLVKDQIKLRIFSYTK